MTARYRLVGADGKPYDSAEPGTIGGHRRSRIYGRLDCPSAARALAKGGYADHRVFFADEATAMAAGYRPCAVCMPERYARWRGRILPRSRTEVAPGAVHLPDWLDVAEQRRLVEACREWARPPAPMRATRLPSGGTMSVRTACLGWHWRPYRYSRTADDVDGAPVPPLPDWLADLGRKAVADAYADPSAGAAYEPDIALINYYDSAARMGMHRDADERADDPVVSLSIGDTCTFRFGNNDSRGRPWTDVELRSGDLFVFGGPSRFAYHGVPKVLPNTADPACGLETGRLNITMRASGLD
jgi:alkylated DNA repair protein (DNA oxidative demethylase)